MIERNSTILTETIKRLLRRNAITHLAKIVSKTHAADLSQIFRAISLGDQKKIFHLIDDPEKKAFLFSELEGSTFHDLIEELPIDAIVEVIEHMPADDAANLIDRLPEEKSALILEQMKDAESTEVEDLLCYSDGTAGRIMVTDFVALKENLTAREAIEAFQREHLDVEMPFYIYVVDDNKRLVGVISLRQLVVVKPETPLKDFMTTDIFSVRTDIDQEEVAKIVARYDILAVPVVDEQNVLVGIVTVDDVIDIFRKEATEDMLKMAGVGETFVETQSVFRSIRIRLPWLFASCLGGIAVFFIIGGFEASLARFACLAAFIPVITGMGGNVGTQSSTIVVRGLATGRFQVRNLWPVMLKELSIGLILGMIYGLLIGTVAQFYFGGEGGTLYFPIAVGLSVLCSMCLSSFVGSFVPMFFARVHIDPAVATGPFVTTAIDIISVSCYFRLATSLMGI